MNHVTLSGRIASDIRTKDVNGKMVAEFRFAVQITKDKAEFFNIVCWESRAENLVKFQDKGSKLLLAGRLKQQSWKSGDEFREKTVVVADFIEYMDSKTTQTPTAQDESIPSTTLDAVWGAGMTGLV